VEPAPLLHRRPAADAGLFLAPALAVVASLLLAHHRLLASGLARVPGDAGDVRFVHYCIEHTWVWLVGHPLHRRFWELPFFHPAPDVGAYSDVLLGVAPPYWLFRALGAGPDRAYALWLLTTTALNAAVGTWALRTVLGVGRVAAAMGAVLLAAGAPRIHVLNHPQLVGAAWLLLVLGLVAGALRAPGTVRARLAWLGAGLAFAAQAWSSYYLWWFLGLGLGVAAAVALAGRRTRGVLGEALRQDGRAIGCAALLSALLLFPLLHTWWQVAQVVGLRPVQNVFLARGQSWLNPGPDSWWYGALVRRLPGLRTQTGEQELGVGLVTTGVALAGLWWARHRPVARVLAVTAALLVVLGTQLGPWRGASPWNAVAALLPGAAAIRAVPRLGLLVLLAWAAGLALAVDAARRRGWWAAALLGLGCLLEQGVSFAHFSPAEERGRVDRLAAAVVPRCAAFVYTPAPDGWPAWRSQIDAVWATDASGVPTLNGYSGNLPPGWGLEDCLVRGPADRARLDTAAADWIRRWGLQGEVCRLPPGQGL